MYFNLIRHPYKYNIYVIFVVIARIPTVKLKIPEKSIFEIRISNFCYIQVTVFDLIYLPKWQKCERFYIFHIIFMVADLLSPNRRHW